MLKLTAENFTGYENAGFAACIQGKTANENPWIKTFAGHTEWNIGHAMAVSRGFTNKPDALAPLPLYSVLDVGTASIDARGFRVTYARLGAQFSKESAEEYAKSFRRMGRLAKVVEVTPAEQAAILSGAWDGYRPTPELLPPTILDNAAAA